MISRLLISLLVAIAAVAALPGCKESDTSGPAGQFCSSIVTFAGNDSGESVFEYRVEGDSPLIRLTGGLRLDESKVAVGSRLLMAYGVEPGKDPLDGGRVEIYSLQYVINDTVTLTDRLPSEPGPLYLLTLTRSGEYIDIFARMQKTPLRSIAIVADTSAIDADGLMPLCVTAVDPTQPTSYQSQAVASLWIGPAWSNPRIRGVRITVDNANNPYRNEFVFYKSNLK